MNNLEHGVEKIEKLVSKSDSNNRDNVEVLAEETAQSDTPTKQSYKDVVKQLAKLKPYEYDRVRKEQAKALGVQIKTLDTDVKALRNDGNEAERLPFPEVAARRH